MTSSVPSSPRPSSVRQPRSLDDSGIKKSKEVFVLHKAADGSVYRITLYDDSLSLEARRKSAAVFVRELGPHLQQLEVGGQVDFEAVAEGLKIKGGVKEATVETKEAKQIAEILRSKKDRNKQLITFAETYQKAHTVAQKTLAPPPSPKAALPISPGPKTTPVPRKQILQNIGNSCFLDATLELFPQEIRRELLKYPEAFGPENEKNPFYVVLYKYELGRSISANDLRAVQRLTKMQLNRQADAHEAFCRLADTIQLEPLIEKNSPLVAVTRTWHTPNVNLTPPVEWKSNAQEEYQFIGRMFVVPEEGLDVETLLKDQLVDQKVTENFHIGHQRVPVKTKIAFETAPNYLLVQIKRDKPVTTVDAKDSKKTIVQNRKDPAKIKVKTQLHLSADATNENEGSNYQLTGFTVHIPSGDETNAGGGHWVAYRLEGGKWYLFDDLKPAPQNIDDMDQLRAEAGKASQLMYIKTQP